MGNCPICLVGVLSGRRFRTTILTCTRAKAAPLFKPRRLPGLFFLGLITCILVLIHSCQVGSALCGAAQNMTWLIVCRAFQGIGGGGLMQLSMITISDIVPLKEYVFGSYRSIP